MGSRGARTRERIVTETLALFAEIGYHETTVRDISAAAEVSRATLYQYFESKDEIFIQLLDECGGALLAVMRTIGPLGPTTEGYANLRRWLVDWAEVYAKYGTLFVEWANVDVPGTPVRGLVSNFVRSYNHRIANRFRSSGVEGIDAKDAAVVVTSIIHRYNYLRYVSPAPHRTNDEAADDMTTVLQLLLFPHTPHAVVTTNRARAELCSHSVPQHRKPPAVDATAKFDDLTPRSAATVEQILLAGAECFAASGYHGANVDDIVKRAGFARGTFYKYFNEKLDLLLVLSNRCELRFHALNARFAQIEPTAAAATELRAWLADFLAFRASYIGVIRSWIDRTPADPALSDARRRMAISTHDALKAVVGCAPLAGIVSVSAAETALIGILERLPDAVAQSVRRPQLAELMAVVIERALIGTG